MDYNNEHTDNINLSKKYKKILEKYKVNNIFDAVVAKHMIKFINKYDPSIEFSSTLSKCDNFIQGMNENHLYYKFFQSIPGIDLSLLNEISSKEYSLNFNFF